MFKHKKLAAVVMSLMMVMSLMPAMAFAESGLDGVKIKVNGGGSEFNIEKGNTIELKSEITGMGDTPYHIHWEKTNGKKYYAFVNDAESSMVSGSSVTIKGIDASEAGNPPKLTIAVVEGAEHTSSCPALSDIKNKKDLTINVVDSTEKEEYSYGKQGKDTNKQSLEMTSPNKITQLYPNSDGQEITHFMNRIDTPFEENEPVKFTFIVGKGMGNRFNETDFIDYAVQTIVVTDKNNDTVASFRKGNIKFLGQNQDGTRSVSIQVEGLAPGEYTLIFGKELKPSKDGAELGVDVSFQFQIAGTAPVNPDNEPADEPNNEPADTPSDTQDTDSNTEQDNTANADNAVRTGDEMNIALHVCIMLAALCGGAVVFVRRKEQ